MHGDGQLIDTDEGPVYVEIEGQGSPVVLVPGGPGVGHAHYHPWFSRLADRHTVVYYDAPGTGRSTGPPRPRRYTVPAYAAVVEAVRRHLAADRISLVGLSFGGFAALEYALRHPDRVHRLVASNAAYSADSWQRGNIDNVNHEVRVYHPERWAELLRLRAAGITSLDPRYQDLLAPVLPHLEWADPDRRPALSRDPAEPFHPEVYAAFVGADPEWEVTGSLAGYDPSGRLATLAVPTLVLTGRHDRVTPPAIAYALHRLLPGSARLVVFERSAHRPWAEEPDAYFGTLAAFLAGAEAAPARNGTAR